MLARSLGRVPIAARFEVRFREQTGRTFGHFERITSSSSSSSGTKPLPPHVGHCRSSSVPFSMTPSPLQSGQVFTCVSLWTPPQAEPRQPNVMHGASIASVDLWVHSLALLWQIFSGVGFPNQFFCDSWVVGFWRGRPSWAGPRIGRKSLDAFSSRFWLGWVTRRGDKCVHSTCRG